MAGATGAEEEADGAAGSPLSGAAKERAEADAAIEEHARQQAEVHNDDDDNEDDDADDDKGPLPVPWPPPPLAFCL